MDRINELIYLALEGIDNGQFEDSSLKCILKDTLSNMGLRVSDIVLFSYFEEIREKLGQISKLVRYVFIESEYNETAWKDMVALFYVNTMPNIKNSVIRVHMFKDIAEVESPSSLDLSDTRIYNACQNAYLGYFNIRPINSLYIIHYDKL